MLDMVLGGFVAMKSGVPGVAIGELRLASRQRAVRRLAIFGGLSVMPGRLGMMIGGGGVVFGIAELGLQHVRGLLEFLRQARDELRIFRPCGAVELGVIASRFVAVVDGVQGMPMRHQRPMRRMGVVLPGLVMPRGLLVIARGLLMMIGSRRVML